MNYLSVCSGIEAATVAWHPLGWNPVAFSEIESFPSQVLKHHYPTVPNMGDMTKFKEWQIESNVDVLVGGTPCQSFSVAGLRKGLDDPRGNLMLTYLAIAKQHRPRWLVWENVPGVLSSADGRDFGSFLGGLAICGYGFAYRVLDAQYFGVAQRRRRVFVVGYLGDWRPAAAVLFERHSLSGNSAPSREKREDPAKCLTRGAGQRYDFETEDLIPQPIVVDRAAFNQGENAQYKFRAEHSETMDCLVAKGPHAVLQPVYEMHGQDSRVRELGDVCTTVSATYGTGGGNVPVTIQPIGVDTYNGTETGQVSCTITADVGGPTHSGPKVMQPIPSSNQTAWSMNLMSPGRKVREDHGVGALTQQCHCPTQGNEAVVIQQAMAVRRLTPVESERLQAKNPMAVVAPTLTAANDPSRSPQSSEVTQQVYSVYQSSMAVRRLTPVECERLQGFPDNYTDIKSKNKPTPDGPRYKALGNSMAVPVMAWIGERINQVEVICQHNK